MARNGQIIMAKQSIKNIWYEFLAAEDFFNRFDDSSDVIFELDDGSKWAVTFFTYKNIETIRKKNQLTGECLGGTYFCATDMVLISELSEDTIKKVLQEMLASDEISTFCSRLS